MLEIEIDESELDKNDFFILRYEQLVEDQIRFSFCNAVSASRKPCDFFDWAEFLRYCNTPCFEFDVK